MLLHFCFRDDFSQFQMSPPEFPQCDQVETDLKQYEETWDLFDRFNTGKSFNDT